MRTIGLSHCRFLLLAAALFLAPWAQSEERFPDIKTLMDEETYRAAGLHTLSEEQLAALNAWLIRYTAKDAETIARTSPEVKEIKKEVRKAEATIDDFSGWSGDTIFRLSNNEVWQQRLEGTYNYQGEQPAKVVVRRNMFGFFVLEVVDTGRSVGVKRVR